MSYQIITRMSYNAATRCIDTWQHSNNVWPRHDHFHALDVSTDERMFKFIRFIADGAWQTRKWRREFNTLFNEYPELRMDSYQHELSATSSWKEYCAVHRKYEELAESKMGEITARFRQLAKIG